jgi:hypothetical protein
MEFLSLLGKQIKDDEVIDVLEGYDMEVIYEFDRLHEGMPDEYTSVSKPDGFEFHFDESQTLQNIFLYRAELYNFSPISPNECDVPLFDSTAEAQAYGEAQQLNVRTGTAELLGVKRDSVKLHFETHSIHYEFREGVLALVTLSRIEEELSG